MNVQSAILMSLELILLFQFVITANGEQIDATERVLNGTASKLGQFPFAVRIFRIAGGHACSGSLISPSHVITCAHCYSRVSRNETRLGRCMVGDINKETVQGPAPESRQMRDVAKYSAHPKYYNYRYEYDIAIVTVTRPFVMSMYVKTIPLAGSYLPPGTSCIAVGFGRQTYNYTKPTNASLAWASFSVDYYRDPGVIRFSNPYQAVYFGDSGGALIDKLRDPQLFGVLASVFTDDNGYHKNYATKISPHRKWIFDQMDSARKADRTWSGTDLLQPTMWLYVIAISKLG